MQALVAHMSDGEIDAPEARRPRLRASSMPRSRPRKSHGGQPTVILAKTKKGYGMGGAGESRMTAHQAKKLDCRCAARRSAIASSCRCRTKMSRRCVLSSPPRTAAELAYLEQRARRARRPLPVRRRDGPPLARAGAGQLCAVSRCSADGKEMSTTMAAVRMLGNLLRDKTLGAAHRADRRGRGTHLRHGTACSARSASTPRSASSTSRKMPARCSSYKRSARRAAAGGGHHRSRRAVVLGRRGHGLQRHGIAMLPFYIYYSMFGFQRVGDLIWAAADQRARGFLFGATAGRTTLGGRRACSIRTAPVMWSRRRCRIAAPTIPRSPTSWR